MAIKTYKKGDSTKLSPNFRAREFDCPGTGCCNQTPIDEKLVAFLQKIRDHFGKPVHVTAYRCTTHNAKVPNAAPKSKHTLGMAADIGVDGVAPAEVAKYAESIGVKGIGLYEGKDGNFVHIDTRTSKSFWYGHAQQYRSTFGGTPPVEGYTLEQFVRDVQTAIGATVDGKAGPETLSKTPTISARKNNRHPVVKPVQKRMAALGYTQVGEADGIAGAKFTDAVCDYQYDTSSYVDGEITAKNRTWRKLLGME